MADWFKLYENDLDDERLQWAMSEQQQTAIIYVTILSRCCRDKSGILPWKGESFELFALAQKAHVSPPVANQALGLLEKIEFIRIENNELKVLRWNDRQSEYCQKKSVHVPTVSRHYPDKVPTVSPERRGEENRKDKKESNGVLGVNAVIKNQELGRAMERLNVIRSQYEAHQNWDEKDKTEAFTLKQRIKTLKAELGVLV